MINIIKMISTKQRNAHIFSGIISLIKFKISFSRHRTQTAAHDRNLSKCKHALPKYTM